MNDTTIRWLPALALACLVAGPAVAADHREAPMIQEDPTADLGDIYAFFNPDDASKLVVVMTVNPFAVPAEAVTYNFSPNVRYRCNIDNDGDADADRRIDVTFSPTVPGPQTVEARFPGGIVVTGNATPPTEEPEPEDPIIIEGPDGIRVFAGPRDDPFFFDIVGFFRFLDGTGTFDGTDGFGGFNVSAIVLEFPVSMVADGADDLQIWCQTDRQRNTIRFAPRNPLEERLVVHQGSFRQIERNGNPAVSSALIPTPQRDAFNFGLPENDARDFAGIIVDRLMALGTNDANIAILASVAVPDTLKLDLTQPVGFPNGRDLDDDVIDTLFFFISNQGANFAPTDLVDANDRPFLNAFPYLAPPFQPD